MTKLQIRGRDTLALLAKGEILQSGRHLFQQKDGRILVSGPSFHSRLDPDAFLDLYGGEVFWIRETGTSIDQEKDEAYYRWRREKQ